MRLLWKLFTPRGFRRATLAVIVVWALVAWAHYAGVFGEIAQLWGTVAPTETRLPTQVHSP